MRARDTIRFASRALIAHRLRTALTMLGIAVGVGAVVLLTSIGEGTQRFVLAEFTQFGTHLIEISPGKTSTHGVPGAFLGTIRPLTIDDAESLRRISAVRAVSPVVQGNAEAAHQGRKRRVTIFGVGSQARQVWTTRVQQGSYLPDDDPRAPRALCVIGSKVRKELFQDRNPLGERVKIAGEPYRVIGILESKGNFLGTDLDDTISIPFARALDMFDRDGAMAINVLYDSAADADSVKAQLLSVLIERHGQEDVTVTTQQEMLDTLGSILNVLTFAVGALGGISTLVGGVGILTIMTIAVRERTNEVGLLRALGAPRRRILWLFLGEALALGLIGGAAGFAGAFALSQLLHLLVPKLPVHTSWAVGAVALTGSLLLGLVAGVLPARRAAQLDPVDALRAE
jgi:putative ABC transport system permease protein